MQRSPQWVFKAAAGLAVGTLLMLGATLLPVARAQSVDPKTLVLSLDELPPGFAANPDASRFLTNEDAANGDEDVLDQFTQFGRQAGYEARYELASPGLRDLLSILVIVSNVSVYATPEGARGLFQLRQGSDPPTGWQRVSAPQLGDGSYAITEEQKAVNGTTYVYRYIILRKGPSIASVLTVSLTGVSFEGTVALARASAAKL